MIDSFEQYLEEHSHPKRHPKESWEIENIRLLSGNIWKKELGILLTKWIDLKSGYTADYLESYKDSLFEFLEILVGRSPDAFYANVNHRLFGYECEILGFSNNGKAFYLEFSFFD